MSFPVKSAMAVVLTFGSFTAAIASGVSGADNAPSDAALLDSARHPATISSTSAASAAQGQIVRFGPLKEVVQPLNANIAKPADAVEAASQTATLRAGDFIAVPDKNYSSLNAMVRDVDTSAALVDEQTRCLATAIFYESRSESLEGQLAVARVIVNRVESSRFGDTLCSVVKQPGQFSFVRGGVLPKVNESKPAWKTSMAIAHIALNDAWESRAEGALFFHARHVSPGWKRARVATIDNHIFYR